MGSNPFLSRGKGVGSCGRRAEERSAKRDGGRRTIASGATDRAKADHDAYGFKCENKATEADSLRLDYGWMRKVAHEATSVGRRPALKFQFVTGDGKPRPDGAWVCVPEGVWRAVFGDE